MATYLELIAASNDTSLKQRIAVACVVAAETIRTEDPITANHGARVVWAKAAYDSPESAASKLVWSVLAQNRTATAQQIADVTDDALQTAVDAAIVAFL